MTNEKLLHQLQLIVFILFFLNDKYKFDVIIDLQAALCYKKY